MEIKWQQSREKNEIWIFVLLKHSKDFLRMLIHSDFTPFQLVSACLSPLFVSLSDHSDPLPFIPPV